MSQAVLVALVSLACPIGMGLMMWMMMRGQHHSGKAASGDDRAARLAELRAEIAQLKADQAAWHAAQER
jgi:hypothetical protein